MSFIAINTKYVTINPIPSNVAVNRRQKRSFFISSAVNELSIRNDDKLIIAAPIYKDLKFTEEAVVTKTGDVRIIKPSLKEVEENNKASKPPLKEKYEHPFELEIIKQLSENNTLNDLEYSLQSVYSYHKPIVHFQQQFRALNKNDFETIVNGWVYSARTVFGKLANAMPRQNKLELMLQAMDKFNTVDFAKISLLEGLNFLYDYIDRRILSRGRILVSTNNLIETHLSGIVPSKEIGLINPETGKFNLINHQAKVFEKLLELEDKMDFRKFIFRAISENAELEYRFMQIFKNESWPIDLQV